MPILKVSETAVKTDVSRMRKVERIGKQLMSTLSRDLVSYVYESNDIGLLNRLIEGLTPMNKQAACLYYAEFIGWKFDKDLCEFGGKMPTAMYKKRFNKAKEWLSDGPNDIWHWIALTQDKKPNGKAKEYADKITKLAKKALNDAEEDISPAELIAAIMAADGSLKDLMMPLDDAEDDKEEA